MKEIERKFLLKNKDFLHGVTGQKIIQSYIFDDGARGNLRVRIYGSKAFLTIKGKPSGISRSEFEYEIPMQEAKALLEEFCPIEKRIEKTRYKIPADQNLTWEIDLFEGANAGLMLAEIELEDEEQHFSKPTWLGQEVSKDTRFFNSSLSQKPYSQW